MPREISQRIEINNIPDIIFSALLNPSAIIEWWHAKTAIVIKEKDGIYAVSWGNDIDDPDYITTSIIKDIVQQEKLILEYSSYFSKLGKLPFEAKMSVQFIIIPKTEIKSVLEVIQSGIPDDQIANEYFEGCTNGWIQVLGNIKKYCENI